MGRKSLVAAFALSTVFCHLGAEASDFDNGNVWLERCKSNDPTRNLSCMSFVAGFSNGITAQAIGSHVPKIYCQPEGVTYGQSADIWVKYMQENPSKRHSLGGVLFMLSHIQAFPCPTGKK